MPGVVHWGPLTALTIIFLVTFTGIYGSLQLWSLPSSIVRYFRLTHFILMYIWPILVLKNFYQALKGPGYVPLGWKPADKSDEEFLQFCHVCKGFKPPRSHHCKQCGRCIKKMDHHCPWINHCVGHENHAAFTRFLFYVPFGCIHGTIINFNFLYRLLTYEFIYHRPYLAINTVWIILIVLGIGMAIGTTIGVFVLFVVQVKSIWTNRTQIEDWIMDKAQRRREKGDQPFVYPYDLGHWNNFTHVINWSGKPKGDGISWPVKEGCTQYTFTVEQLEQKKLKRFHSVVCRVKRGFRVSCFPLSFGLMVCLCAPKCSEGKIPVEIGDVVMVTRWQTYWVYGDKQLSQAEVEQGKRVKGWFPRRCVAAIANDRKKDGKRDQDNGASTVRKRTKNE